jgi:hypothetical protein
MTFTRAALVCIVTALLFFKASQAQTQFGQMFGFGRLSCANWVNNPLTENEAVGWILGYWTGLNTFSSNPLVGHLTDGQSIVAEVRRACGQYQLERILDVEFEIYKRIWTQEVGHER